VNGSRLRMVIVAMAAGTLAASLGVGRAGASARTGAAPTPEISGPITGGTLGGPRNAVPPEILKHYHYVEEEYFLSGTATKYAPVGELGSDGRWDVEAAGEAPYKTRVLVRRPKDLDDFSGAVVVEWLNTTAGVDADADFGMLHPALFSRGYAYVGVSAQSVSINGAGGVVLDIPGAPPPELLLPLTKRDPERYGTLTHPGDDYSYDIATQAGRAARSGDLLGGKKVDRVILVGESQSAGRLGTYINGIQPKEKVFDGFLVHSRGQIPAPLAAGVPQPSGMKIRTDLDVPVLQFETETDLVGLEFIPARQPDSDRLRTWEVAGTAHADDSLVEYGRRSFGTSFDLTAVCGPPNNGPMQEVLRAGFVALDDWVANGTKPPKSPQIETSGDTIVRADDGIAVGGIRTPDVDAPITILTGESNAESRICSLFGSITPLTPEQLAERYPTHKDYVRAVTKSADAAVEKGFLLSADRNAFIKAAKKASVPS